MAANKKGSKHFDFTKDRNSGGGRFDFTKDEPEKSHFQKFGKWYICGGVGLACLAAVAFWPKNQGEGKVTPPVDSLTQVVDTPAVKEVVKESDTVSNVQKVTPINEGVDKKQDEVPSETPEAKEAPKAKTVTTSTKSSNTRSGDVTVDAKKAIRGDFGNGAERRRQLGDDYEQVQALVNKMYREGKLYC